MVRISLRNAPAGGAGESVLDEAETGSAVLHRDGSGRPISVSKDQERIEVVGRGCGRGPAQGVLGVTTASASISTRASGIIRRETSTMVVAGRMAAKTSACSSAISGQWSRLVT